MPGLQETIIFLKLENFTLYQQIFFIESRGGKKLLTPMTV